MFLFQYLFCPYYYSTRGKNITFCVFFFIYHYTPVSQASWCNMTFTAGNLLSTFYACFFQTALISPGNEEYDYLLDKLNERIIESGETIYEIGTGGM